MTNRIANATMKFPCDKDYFCYYDVEQVMITLYRFVKNVDRPKLVLPPAYLDIYHDGKTGQEWVELAESLITGWWTDDEVEDEYWLVEYRMDSCLSSAQRDTGAISKAMFEKTFGRKTRLLYDEYEQFKRDWPFTDTLSDLDRPRRRWVDEDWYHSFGYSYVELEMPDPAWFDPRNFHRGWKIAEEWHKDTSAVDW